MSQDRTDEDIIETMLFLRQVTPESFRRYTVVAENIVGVRKHDVQLLQSKVILFSKISHPRTQLIKLTRLKTQWCTAGGS
jgi:hypothetical protein